FPQNLTGHHYARLAGFGADATGDTTIWLQFRGALINSLVTSLAATLLCVLISALGGYAFARLPFWGRDVIFMAVVATLAIPGYAVLIPLYRLMIGLRLIDTYLGITLIYVSANLSP